MTDRIWAGANRAAPPPRAPGSPYVPPQNRCGQHREQTTDQGDRVRSSAKYALYGLVLTAMVGGTTAWVTTDKAIAISVDGQSRTVRTRAGTVGGALHDAHLDVTAHDAVAPAVPASVHDGSRVVLRRGRLLHLNVDGSKVDVWTTATTVQEALAQLGYGSGKAVSVSRSTRLPLTPTQISLLTPKPVTLKADGHTRVYRTTADSVSLLLLEAGVRLGLHDRISVPMSTPTKAGQVIVVQRVKTVVRSTKVAIPYETTTKKDPTARKGDTSVVREGREGLRRITYQLIYVDGKLVGKRQIGSVVLRQPVDQQEKVGTKNPPPPPPAPAPTSGGSSGGSSGSSSGGSGGPAPVSSGDAQAIAAKMVSARGWGSGEFQCLVDLWNRESGWNVHASNPSGAYGIPQALPGSKMATAGPDWENNASTQITWGLGYIASVYGTPCAAWAHSNAYNWY
ncbi:MAG: ubiquitin-like domain-containing protein [bacterium]